MEGIEGIWKIALDSVDYKVTEKAFAFLIYIYTSVAYEVQEQLPAFEEEFI